MYLCFAAPLMHAANTTLEQAGCCAANLLTFAGKHVPGAQRVVPGRGGQQRASGAEGEARDRALVPRQHLHRQRCVS